MANYFDKKEDVLEIVLTPHGRRLLSQGKLMPEYYSFLDDDVIYDAAAAGGSESNYQVKTRILTETPSLKPQSNLVDLQAKLKDENPDLSSDSTKYDLYTIGTSNTREEFAPSWQVKFIRNEISASATYQSSPFGIKNVPQIETEIEYKISVGNRSNDQRTRGQESSPELPLSKVYSDGSYVKVQEEQILMNILEKNGFLHSESLELEVFLYDESEAGNLIPLKFEKRQKEVENDILKDEDVQNAFDSLTTELQTDQVEYYFDVRVDNEIPFDKKEKLINATPIYVSNITKEEIEDCD